MQPGGKSAAKGANRGGCNQCSEGSLSATQSHSLYGLGVVIDGLSVCASPIVGICHQSWGESNDPAMVDCWQFCLTYHCLQQFRQFELSVDVAGAKTTTQLCHWMCTRVGDKLVVSGGARVVATRAGRSGGVGGGNRNGANGGANCCRLQEATTEPAQPIIITVRAGRQQGGSSGGPGLSDERQGSELAEWRSQASELPESAARCRTVKPGCRTVKSGCRTAQAVHISTYLELWQSL